MLTCEEIASLSSEQCENLDVDADGFISYEELVRATGNDCQASIAAVDAEISCVDFEQAQAAIADAFAGVHADDTCRNDLTDSIRIKQIVISDGNGGAEMQDLDEIASSIDIFNASAYDYTVDSTRILFQHYLLFQPGTYEITYEIIPGSGESTELDVTHVQRIVIGQDCGGCFGCNSRCASCRNSYIPAAEKGIKNFLDTFLLLGLAVLVMLAWPGIIQP